MGKSVEEIHKSYFLERLAQALSLYRYFLSQGSRTSSKAIGRNFGAPRRSRQRDSLGWPLSGQESLTPSSFRSK